MRGSREPELSLSRTKDLDHFIRDAEAFQLDHGQTMDGSKDHDLEEFRRRFEELLGNNSAWVLDLYLRSALRVHKADRLLFTVQTKQATACIGHPAVDPACPRYRNYCFLSVCPSIFLSSGLHQLGLYTWTRTHAIYLYSSTYAFFAFYSASSY